MGEGLYAPTWRVRGRQSRGIKPLPHFRTEALANQDTNDTPLHDRQHHHAHHEQEGEQRQPESFVAGGGEEHV